MTTTAAVGGATGTLRTAHAYDDELARLDGVATAAAVRAGDLHPAEVVAAAVARARALEPAIHAVATEDYDRALAAAATAPTSGPFAGVPTFVKDMADVAGLPTRNGSGALRDAAPAGADSGLVAQLLDMGMVGLGKSVMPEFGFVPGSGSPGAEAARNPWNLDHSTGGSSAGAAALVAAGVVPVAHGADGGGSIRIPAACCGLVGLKATRGRLLVPAEARLMPVDVEVEGVLTRSVRDTALFFSEAEKRHARPELAPVGHVTEPLVGRLRIGVVSASPTGELDEGTRVAVESAVALLEGLGHRVEPVPLPVDDHFVEDFVHYWSALAWAVSAQGRRLFDPSFDRDRLTALTHGLARRFRSRWWQTPGAVVRLRRSAQAYDEAMAGLDVLVSPTVATLAPEIGHLAMDLPFDVVFPRAEAWVGYTPLANATGAPAISLPLHRDAATNLPVGVMFSAAHGDEALLLRLALQLEEAAPWPLLGDVAPRSGSAS